MNCPKCNEECWRESVDVGVGVIYGPYGCECGWSENPEFDKTDPNHKSVKDGYYRDQWGGMRKVDVIIENAERFGLGEAAKEAFKEE